MSINRTILIFGILFILAIAGYVAFAGKIGPLNTGNTTSGNGVPATNSDIVRITDTANLYSVEILKDWKIDQEGAMGVQLSRMIAESPDWSAYADESAEGPFTPMYYKTGAAVHIHISNQVASEPYHGDWPNIMESKQIVIDGVTVVYHVFKEPSTQEGLLLDAHLNHNNNAYTFRFIYNPTTYPQGEGVFMDMLNSVRFTK